MSLEGKVYQLPMQAVEYANPPKHAKVMVQLFVAPQDAQIPAFSEREYRFDASENLSVGARIGRVDTVSANAQGEF